MSFTRSGHTIEIKRPFKRPLKIISPMRKQTIQQNLQHIARQLPPQVTLIAVSKTFPLSDIELAYNGGQGHRHFGENRVQELAEKACEAIQRGMDNIQWHFIGRLQSNKFKKLLSVPNLNAIHSITSVKQVELLQKFAPQISRPIKIFLQVKTAPEQEKDGFYQFADLQLAMAKLEKISNSFPLAGLMTIGAIRVDDFAGEAKKCFLRLVNIQQQLGPQLQLSMGMSRDYLIALDYGTNYIRVGSIIFGQRDH